MASIYIRPDSKFWWVAYVDPATGKPVRESTSIPHGDPAGHRQALHVKDVKTRLERIASGMNKEDRFAGWVDDYLATRYSDSPNTLKRASISWRNLSVYFDLHGIFHPAQLNRKILMGYVPWRCKTRSFKGTRRLKLNPNTAIIDIKILSVILQEAVAREIIPFNPASRLDLKRVAPRVKSEPTPEQIATIRAVIARKRAEAKTPQERTNAWFFHASFEIAYHQGLRLTETWFRLDQVDWAENRICNLVAKGRKQFDPPINPELLPFLLDLKAQGRTHTYEMPAEDPSFLWFGVFDKLRAKDPSFKDVSFHSLRVRFVSLLHRSGVPETVAMKMVNHASTTQHRVYRRVDGSEISSAWAALHGAAKPPA